MQFIRRHKKKLAAVAFIGSMSFLVYMLSDSGQVGPPYRDENLLGGPQPLMLVRQPSVREELKLTESQVQQIQAAIEKQMGGPDRLRNQDNRWAPRAARMGRKHQEAFLAGVLQSNQITRLHQIMLQLQGGLALNNGQTADALGLTEAQRKRVDVVIEKLARQLNQPGTLPGPERRKQVETARTTSEEELLKLLTLEQQMRWKELIGEPFTGEIRFGPPRGMPPPAGVPPGEGPPGDGPPFRRGGLSSDAAQ